MSCRVVRSLWLGIKFLQCPIAPRVFQNMSHMLVGTHVVIRGQQNPGVIKEVGAHMAVVEFQVPIGDLEEVTLAAATDSTDRAIPRGPTRSQMQWQSEEFRIDFYQGWAKKIKVYDLVGWNRCSQGEVYLYLLHKLSDVLRTASPKIKMTEAGQHMMDHRTHQFRCGTMWCDGGKHQQEQPYLGNEPNSHYWPIIYLEVNVSDDLLPVYCPGLAWQGSRPWCAHQSRVFFVQTPERVQDKLGINFISKFSQSPSERLEEPTWEVCF